MKGTNVNGEEISRFVRSICHGYPRKEPVLGAYIMHMINPKAFPIYDTNVHRAYHQIIGEGWKDGCLTKCYTNYQKFFTLLRDQIKVEDKRLDEALWAYGEYQRRDKRRELDVSREHKADQGAGRQLQDTGPSQGSRAA